MALFKENKINSEKSTNQSTFIAKEIEVTGDFKGKGSMQIEGIVNGNVSVSSVIIGETGQVNGNIEANNVIVNGRLEGSVKCNALEVMQKGFISHKIVTQNIQVSGSIEGDISVSGLLEILSTGSVTGEIAVNKIATQEGGKIIGSMKIYVKED